MPTLYDRVVKLETRADKTDERIEIIESWFGDESKLREINEKQIELLRQADAIHERRLRELDARIKQPK